MSDCGCEIEIKNKEESRTLVLLLSINAIMFFVEITLGIISESTALIADSMDMLADAIVYGIGLYAVGKEVFVKIKAAHISGIFQIMLGVTVLFDIARRAILGSEPESFLMVVVGIVALIANIVCLRLISKHRNGEVHMRASWIFSKNDVIANLGIILGGVLVYLLDSRFPDLIIGLAISIIVIRGGIHIIKDANNEKQIQSAKEI
ncbi:MAG: cation transporter [Proteobacteria bacterium]|nr:cation transporter [Pseudomonadota bacterium]MCH9712175.1 cation transporter [Pseudomonadota bacterium]MCH9749279.1 cation transporter [Pseudomonadota bacterium]